MALLLKTGARSTLAANLTSTATGAVLQVQSGQGGKFPTFAAGDYAYLTLRNAGGTIEIIRVTARLGDVLTIGASGRGLDGTTAQSWNTGDEVALELPAITMIDILNAQLNPATRPLRVQDTQLETRQTAAAVNQGGLFRIVGITGNTSIEGKPGGGIKITENTASAGDFSSDRSLVYALSNWNRLDSTAGTHPNNGLPYLNDSDFWVYAQYAAINSDNNLRISAASATATVSGGQVTSITVTSASNGYNSAPPVTLIGGGGSGATASASITSGGVGINAVAVTNGGSGYTSAPTVSFSGGGGGSGAAATAVVQIGGVQAVVMTASGSGYTSAPTVSFSGGGGSGANADAYQARSITGIAVTAGGSGYTSAPAVSIGQTVLDPLDVGPTLTLGRDALNPAPSSYAGGLYFGGRSTGSSYINAAYATITARVVDPSAAAPRGQAVFSTADSPAINAGNTPRMYVGWGVYLGSEAGAAQGGDLGKRTFNADAVAADQVFAGDRAGGIPIANYHALDGHKLTTQGAYALRIGYKANTYQATTFYTVGNAGWNTAAAGLTIGANSTTGRSINAGGTINASGGDYAEYVRKRPDCGDIAKGQICGVDSNGELTDRFDLAVCFVVKSTLPAFVGGDTWGAVDHTGPRPEPPARRVQRVETDGRGFAQLTGGETDAEFEKRLATWKTVTSEWEARIDARRKAFDRIAFAGLCPVNAPGTRPGDYVVPVRREDGGIAGETVPPQDLTLKDLAAAVGRVSSIRPDGRPIIIVKAA